MTAAMVSEKSDTDVKQAILKFLGSEKTRKSQQEIVAALGLDEATVVKALRSLRIEQRVRTFQFNTNNVLKHVYEIGAVSNNEAQPKTSAEAPGSAKQPQHLPPPVAAKPQPFISQQSAPSPRSGNGDADWQKFASKNARGQYIVKFRNRGEVLKSTFWSEQSCREFIEKQLRNGATLLNAQPEIAAEKKKEVTGGVVSDGRSIYQPSEKPAQKEAIPPPVNNPPRLQETSASETRVNEFTSSGLKVFKDINPAHSNSVIAAFVRVKDLIKNLPTPRSLCELRLSSGDYSWLENWARGVAPELLEEYLVRLPWHRPTDLAGYSKREAIGTLLLLLAMEAARREGREGSVWPTFANKFGPAAKAQIGAADTATTVVRQSIEAATNALRLRNVYGQTGIQYYYISIFLQFGFTRKGLHQLPYWLTGRTTETIRYLLEESSSTFSDSFKRLWQKLVDFRAGRVNPTDLRKYLGTSPWVLPEWESEILKFAKAEAGEFLWEDDDVSDQLLLNPELRWNGTEQPFVQFQLGSADLLNLSDSAYTLHISGLTDLQLRNSAGQLRSSDQIRIPLSVPRTSAIVLDRSAKEKARMEIDLWDPDEQITVFDVASCKNVDPYDQFLRPSRSYLLITDDDLLPSQELSWVRLNGLSKKCWYLVEGWNEKFEFRWPDGDHCWAPNVSAAKESELPFPVQKISLYCSEKRVHLGQEISAFLQVPESVTIKNIAISGQRIQLPQASGKIDLPLIKITPKLAAAGFKISIFAEYANKKYRLTKELPCSTIGTIRWNGFGWDPLSSEAAIDVDDAHTSTFRFFLPKKIRENPSDYGIFEGDSFCNRLKRRRQPLGTLTGYGAPIVVRKLFNATAEDSDIELSSSVINTGVIKGVSHSDNVTIQVQLKNELELSKSHSLVIWPENQDLIILPYEHLSQASVDAWEAICPGVDVLSACAVAYNGVRIGGLWPESVEKFLDGASSRCWPSKVAAYLRWMGFPILAREHFNAVRKFAFKHPADVLGAWLSEEHVDDSLEYNETSNEWILAVRKVYRNWSPENESVADNLIAKLTDPHDKTLSSAALKLLACDPCLMYVVLRSWNAKHRDRNQLHRCINAILHLTDSASRTDQRHWQDDCLTTASKILRKTAVEEFLEKTAQTVQVELNKMGKLQDQTLKNLDSLLPVSAYRDYLAVTLLSSL